MLSWGCWFPTCPVIHYVYYLLRWPFIKHRCFYRISYQDSNCMLSFLEPSPWCCRYFTPLPTPKYFTLPDFPELVVYWKGCLIRSQNFWNSIFLFPWCCIVLPYQLWFGNNSPYSFLYLFLIHPNYLRLKYQFPCNKLRSGCHCYPQMTMVPNLYHPSSPYHHTCVCVNPIYLVCFNCLQYCFYIHLRLLYFFTQCFRKYPIVINYPGPPNISCWHHFSASLRDHYFWTLSTFSVR